MPSYGYSLMCELYDPNELLTQAARAEAAGFDFITISDHFHPWLFSPRSAARLVAPLGRLRRSAQAACRRSVSLAGVISRGLLKFSTNGLIMSIGAGKTIVVACEAPSSSSVWR
jgi:hypothetical protein